MLTIARTLMGNPDLLLLDEPSEGLAPLVVEALLAKIGELKAQGLTILLAEQGIEFSLALADRVYVLEKGAVRFSGTARGIAGRSRRARSDAGAVTVKPCRILLPCWRELVRTQVLQCGKSSRCIWSRRWAWSC